VDDELVVLGAVINQRVRPRLLDLDSADDE
jgi:hypothetical protein